MVTSKTCCIKNCFFTGFIISFNLCFYFIALTLYSTEISKQCIYDKKNYSCFIKALVPWRSINLPLFRITQDSGLVTYQNYWINYYYWIIEYSFWFKDGKFRCHKKIDLAILVDCSASVTEDQFAASKEFASKLVKHFDISKKRANVAAISFSQYVHTKKDFKDDTSRKSVLKAIDGLLYEGSLTRLDFALETLQGRTFNKAYGARAPSKGT